MREPRSLSITQFVGPRDVMRALDCSETTARRHLHQAGGRKPGQRGLLRVPVPRWEAYVARAFGPAPGTPAALPERPIRPVQPRRRAVAGLLPDERRIEPAGPPRMRTLR